MSLGSSSEGVQVCAGTAVFGGCGCVKRALKLGIKAASFREMTKSGTAELELLHFLPRTQVRRNHFSQIQSPGRNMHIPRLTKSTLTTTLQPWEAQVSRGRACGVENNCWPSGNFSGRSRARQQWVGSNSSPLLKIKSLPCQLWASSVPVGRP